MRFTECPNEIVKSQATRTKSGSLNEIMFREMSRWGTKVKLSFFMRLRPIAVVETHINTLHTHTKRNVT